MSLSRAVLGFDILGPTVYADLARSPWENAVIYQQQAAFQRQRTMNAINCGETKREPDIMIWRLDAWSKAEAAKWYGGA